MILIQKNKLVFYKNVISNAVRNPLIRNNFSTQPFRNDRLSFSFSLLILVTFILLLPVSGFSQNAKRVISLAPSITENIYLIGGENKLVGCTSYCTLGVNDGKEVVGSTIDVNVEKILALQPDLILTMELTKPQDMQTMKKLGLNVRLIPTPKNFEEICLQTLEIGQLIGNSVEAEKVIEKTKQIVYSIKEKREPVKNKPKIFFQLGANPTFTVLQNTFMDDFITLVNGINIANGLTHGTITRESVLVKNPDVIIIATMGGFGKEEQKVWENYSGISAVKNKKVFLIASETSCSPTPENFAQALTEVYQFVSKQ